MVLNIIKIVVLPFIIIIAGVTFLLLPAKKINNIWGFRTRASSRSISTWKYANKRAGQLFLGMGIVLECISLAFVFSKLIDYTQVISIIAYSVLGIIVIVFLIVQVELHKKFDKNGNKTE
ncbi:SdpI family protein [Maledivibacter halophilus]|uniref:SdpI/YhfL protein family protein n=1 Tax=Maledivibacter halophilus TaxID=36842 RepID=A0A1T5JRN4_9FIRM|nr:SdpI family protein [Maledivibacter halophilus]SKC54102.1 SdpI/YhfL protein family protein [Maledivibacter halophilus]